VHADKVVLDPKVDLARVAAMTTGFTGADLANLVNEAAVLATRRDSPQVTFEDVTAASVGLVQHIARSASANAREF
jgi:cell division protease FtsH